MRIRRKFGARRPLIRPKPGVSTRLRAALRLIKIMRKTPAERPVLLPQKMRITEKRIPAKRPPPACFIRKAPVPPGRIRAKLFLKAKPVSVLVPMRVAVRKPVSVTALVEREIRVRKGRLIRAGDVVKAVSEKVPGIEQRRLRRTVNRILSTTAQPLLRARVVPRVKIAPQVRRLARDTYGVQPVPGRGFFELIRRKIAEKRFKKKKQAGVKPARFLKPEQRVKAGKAGKPGKVFRLGKLELFPRILKRVPAKKAPRAPAGLVREKSEARLAEKLGEAEQKCLALGLKMGKAFEGLKPQRRLFAYRKAEKLREYKEQINLISENIKGEHFAKALEISERLSSKGINPYYFMQFGVPAAAGAVKGERFVPEIEELRLISEKVGRQNQNLFEYLRENYNPKQLCVFAELFRPNELVAVDAGKLMRFSSERAETFAKLAGHPYMQRSRNRLVRFSQALGLSEKGAGGLLDFLRGREFGKKQMGELPYIAQYLATYEALSKSVPEIRGATLKEVSAKLEKEVIEKGKERYGDVFEGKLKQLVSEGMLSNLLTVISAASALESNYRKHGFSKELSLLRESAENWMKSKGELEGFKFSDLGKLGVPKSIAEKWELPTRLEAEIKPEEVSVEELVRRVNESLAELPAERQNELRLEYEAVVSSLQGRDRDAQEKTQKLVARIKKESVTAADHLGWVAGELALRSTKPVGVEVSDSVRFSEWLNAGQKFGTCQSWSRGGELNRALVSFVADGNKKIIGVYDRGTGEMLGRGVMHLMQKEGVWGIYVDDVYFTTEQHKANVFRLAEQKAKELGVELFKTAGEFRGKSPYTYANSAGGLVKQKEI